MAVGRAGQSLRGSVPGMILAGGLARRMGGGDKSLRRLAGKTVLDHVITRLGPQVSDLALNANGDPARFSAWGLPVVPDPVEDNPGPLAGILAGLDWASSLDPIPRHVVSAACDAPFLPIDLVDRLQAALEEGPADIAMATSGGRRHPVFALWPVAARADLRTAILSGLRKVEDWTAGYATAYADFSTEPIDPFFNANRPDDLIEAEALVARGTTG